MSMYTRLLITPASAERIHAAARVSNPDEKSFTAYYEIYGSSHISLLDCQLYIERTSGLYSLRFNRYLPEIPVMLTEMDIEIVGVELHRSGSAPTKARAGYYVWKEHDTTATVERVFPQQYTDCITVTAFYAQNIMIEGPSLATVLKFNSGLSQGHFARFLVDPWE